jgi:hypothetical protein
MATTKTKGAPTATGKLLPPRKVGAIIHLQANNDYNGNPRRGFLVLNRSGSSVAFIEEGYEGDDALKRVIARYDEIGIARNGFVDGVYVKSTLPYPVSVPTTPATIRDRKGKAWGWTNDAA